MFFRCSHPSWNVICTLCIYVKNKFLLSRLFKLPDEVCVIRRKQSLKIRQVDKICCCVHLDVVDFKKKRAERAKGSQKAKEKNFEDYAWKDLCEDPIKLKML